MGKTVMQKDKNQSMVLECIFRNAPISRIEIARQTGITPASVTAAVADLIKEAVIREDCGLLDAKKSNEDDGSGSTGRRKIPLNIKEDYAYTIGIEFTPKALVYCLCNLRGTRLLKSVLPFEHIDPAHINEEIVTHLQDFLQNTELRNRPIAGAGLAIPGHCDYTSGELISNNKIWASFNANTIKEKIPFPLVIENNVNCMAIGQYLFHPQDTPEDFLFFHVGHGMYCAHMMHSRIYQKNAYTLGEIGHTIVEMNGPICECGKHGCLQIYASESWLIKHAQLLYENSSTTILKSIVSRAEDITMEHILAAYAMGDSGVRGYVETAIKYLGMTISNLSIIFGAKKTFLHGLLFSNTYVKNELMNFVRRQLVFVNDPYDETQEEAIYNITDGAIGACALAAFEFVIKEHPFSE